MTTGTPRQVRSLRAIWIAILILTATVVAMLVGILFYLTGAGAREVMAAVASAFAGVVTLSLAVWRAMVS